MCVRQPFVDAFHTHEQSLVEPRFPDGSFYIALLGEVLDAGPDLGCLAITVVEVLYRLHRQRLITHHQGLHEWNNWQRRSWPNRIRQYTCLSKRRFRYLQCIHAETAAPLPDVVLYDEWRREGRAV